MIHLESGQRNWSLIGKFIFILAIIIAVSAWVCGAPTQTSAADQFRAEYFHSGWTQHVGDEQIPLENIHDYSPVDAGESLVFTCTLPEIQGGQVLLFYSVNKEVRCYVDDQLIQNFTMQEGYEILDTPGSAWNQVDLDRSMSGKTCTLVFTSPLGLYNSMCNIFFIQNDYVNTVRMECIQKAAISACMIAFITMITLLSVLITKEARGKRYLLSIVQYFLIVLMRLLAELNAFELIFSRPALSYLLGEIFLRLLPISLIYLAKNSTNQYWHPKVLKVLQVMAWGNFVIPLLLQFTLGISLQELRTVHLFISALVDGVLLLTVVEKLFHFKRLKYEEYLSLAIPILIIGGAMDTLIAFFSSIYNPFAGVWAGVGAIVFAIAITMIGTHINVKMAEEKKILQQNYRGLESVILGRQLEAHFIFNVLNTISAYCKTDPAEADRAIISFASYLRSYLHHMHQRDNIPFKDELSLVKEYLTIQQMRFGDDLQFDFDVNFMDFDVPPFGIYTLVENAVIHGIKKKHGGGVVTISTVKANGYIQVVVADTGAGFDTTLPVKETSVGMSNTKRRFELMKNATLVTQSSIGIGATVTITIPN